MRIYADIAGDLFHYGHADFFKKLHQYGNYVIIGLHSDQDIFNYKGKYPILTMEERKRVIETCKYVNEVWINTPVFLTEKYLIENNIDLVAHAHHKDDKTYDEYYSVPIKLGKFIRLDYTNGISSSEIIKRCIERYGK
jgi:cytidyltransferase-like protein